MLNFIKWLIGKEPKVVINIARATATEESCSITVNACKVDRNDIFKALNEAGEALRLRLIQNNQIAMDAMKSEISSEKVVDPTIQKQFPKRVK